MILKAVNALHSTTIRILVVASRQPGRCRIVSVFWSLEIIIFCCHFILWRSRRAGRDRRAGTLCRRYGSWRQRQDGTYVHAPLESANDSAWVSPPKRLNALAVGYVTTHRGRQSRSATESRRSMFCSALWMSLSESAYRKDEWDRSHTMCFAGYVPWCDEADGVSDNSVERRSSQRIAANVIEGLLWSYEVTEGNILVERRCTMLIHIRVRVVQVANEGASH